MIIWIFMILDFVSLTFLSLAHFNIYFSFAFLLASSVYLIGKGIMFRDVMSFIDLGFGVYMILVAFLNFSSFVYYLALMWFLYKLVFTVVRIS